MALDAVAELLVGTVRFIGRIVFDVLLEIPFHGTGWLLLKPFYGKEKPPERQCILVGVIVWIAVAAGIFVAWR